MKMTENEIRREATIEEMNRIILEKVPYEERVRSVYLPIIVMDCACYIADELLELLRTLRLPSTKKSTREINFAVNGYRKDNEMVMHSDQYRDFSSQTKDYYQTISTDMFLYRVQYCQALLNRKLHLDTTEEEHIMAYAYVIRDLAQYVIDLDRSFSNRISELLGKDIEYTTEDNGYAKALVSEANKLLDILGVPKDLSTEQTQLAFSIFKNKLKTL